MSSKKTAYILFIAGISVTFSFITALQFISPKKNIWLFIAVLAAMHAGIVCFILSKRQYKKLSADVKKFFRREYYFLLWYLPVLAAKLFLPLFTPLTFDPGSPEYFVKAGAVIAMTAVFAAESVFNAMDLLNAN